MTQKSQYNIICQHNKVSHLSHFYCSKMYPEDWKSNWCNYSSKPSKVLVVFGILIIYLIKNQYLTSMYWYNIAKQNITILYCINFIPPSPNKLLYALSHQSLVPAAWLAVMMWALFKCFKLSHPLLSTPAWSVSQVFQHTACNQLLPIHNEWDQSFSQI